MPALVTPALGRPFWLANLVNLLCLSGGSMFVLLPLYLERNGLERWEIGLVGGAFSVASVLARPWLGGRIDRRGRRRYFLAGALLTSLAALAYLVAPPDFPSMIALRALQGVGLALYFTSMWTWITDYAPPERLAEVSGLFGISGLVAGALGPVLGEAAFALGGFPAVFAGGFSLGLAAAGLARSLEDRLPEGAAAGDPEPASVWGAALGPALGSGVLAALAFGIATGTQLTFAAPFAHLRGLATVAPYFVAYTASSVCVRLFAGRFADRAGPQHVVVPALASMATGLLLFSRLGGPGPTGMPLLLAAGFVGGLGHGSIYPAMSTLFVQRTEPRQRGTSVSLFTAVIDIGAFLGATLSGAASHSAGYPATFLGVSLAVMAAAACFPLLEARYRQAGFPGPAP